MKRVFAIVVAVMVAISIVPVRAFAEGSAAATTPSGIAYEDIGTSIDGYIAERKGGLASCAVGVFDRDGAVYNGYYGWSDMQNEVEANGQTVYEWGSTSKLLVWVSVMQQWERGKLDLEADIREYLPEGFLTKLRYPDEKITMLNLMNHNAGFQESFYENQEAAIDDIYDSLEDAVRACECYQAFHVGEYTAYSNWGCALAAYIVERTSGMDYVTYVNENIFAPLGMAHTSIDPQQADNEWVGEQRRELRCYNINSEAGEDFGECRYAVQLFPAGAAMGTLEDLSMLGQAFVSEDCLLFGNSETRDEMLRATSFYGDTDMAKNCHGLWTQERAVETLGHGGNTGGCTANLEFDPVSGLGVAVLTNELGETAFCEGIPALLFGHLTDREGYRDYAGGDADISGVYYGKRSICEGASKAAQYLAGVFPLSKDADGGYSIRLLGISFMDGIEFVPVGENQYVMMDNGRELFVYVKDGLFELGFQDYVRSPMGAVPTAVNFGFMLFGALCLLMLLVKGIVYIARRVRKSERHHVATDRRILAQQAIYAVSGVIAFLFLLVVGSNSPALVTVSCVLAAICATISLANGLAMAYSAFKSDDKARAKTKRYLWAALAIAYAAYIVAMQYYCFWKL